MKSKNPPIKVGKLLIATVAKMSCGGRELPGSNMSPLRIAAIQETQRGEFQETHSDRSAENTSPVGLAGSEVFHCSSFLSNRSTIAVCVAFRSCFS